MNMETFKGIHVHETSGCRIAKAEGVGKVWMAISLSKKYGMTFEQMVDYYQCTEEQMKSAFTYYDAHREEIDRLIEENDAITWDDLKKRHLTAEAQVAASLNTRPALSWGA